MPVPTLWATPGLQRESFTFTLPPTLFACTSMCCSHVCEIDVQVLLYNVYTCSNSLSQILNYGNSRRIGPAGEVGYFWKTPSRHYWWCCCDLFDRFLEALRVQWRKNTIWKNWVFE
jgi:hypothetical protein